jgi:hypothetical protein
VCPPLRSPCRCAREAGAHAAGARARGRARESDICTRAWPDSALAEARLPQRDASATPLALAIGTCERAASPVLPDGLRVAPPVQAAAAACGWARRPPRSRHLRHDRQARRRHNGHDDPAVITPAGSAAWPRRREACACEPGAVVLGAAAPSAHCSTRSPSRTAPSTPSWSSAPCKPWRCHAGAASRHGSTTSPPLARDDSPHSSV